MDKIYKYAVPSDPGIHAVEMPCHAQLLSVASQAGRMDQPLSLWASVEPSNHPIHRRIEVRMTGQNTPTGAAYLGTALLSDGDFILHVFDHGEFTRTR